MGEKLFSGKKEEYDPHMVETAYQALLDYFPLETTFQGLRLKKKAAYEEKVENIEKILMYMKTLKPESRLDFLQQLFPRKRRDGETGNAFDELFDMWNV